MRNKLYGLACMLILSVSFIAFQNFTLLESNKVVTNISKKSLNMHETPRFVNINAMNLWRKRVWASSGCLSQEWEVCFEGVGIPGWNQRSHLDWDNAIDDDWDESLGNSKSWIVNLEKENGFMHVNRTIDEKIGSSGHFWRRDEYLNEQAGFEAEFKVKIYSDSQSNGVKFHFFNEKHQFKIVFSPDEIHFHDLIGNGSRSLAGVRTNNTDFALYKVIYKSGLVSIWKDDNPLLLDMRPGRSDFIEKAQGKFGHIAPRIGFGDNNNYMVNHQGHYGVAFFRYKRANLDGVRKAPLLPMPQECGLETSWTNVDIAKEIKGKTVSLDSAKKTLPLPLFGFFGKTIEFMADINFSKTRALSLDFGDHLGGIVLSVKKDRIEMKANTKPGLPTTVRLRLDGLNKYRLVRSDLGLYWYLYLNDGSVPILVDVRASGSSISEPESFGNIPRQVIHIGPFLTPSLLDFSRGMTVAPRGNVVIGSKMEPVAFIHDLKIIDKAIGANFCEI